MDRQTNEETKQTYYGPRKKNPKTKTKFKANFKKNPKPMNVSLIITALYRILRIKLFID